MSACRIRVGLGLVAVVGVIGCGGDAVPAAPVPLGGALTVTGRLVDLEDGTALTTAATVTTSGLLPPPQITVLGAEFTITGIPENSAFQVLAGAPPSHRATFSSALVVATSDIDGFEARAVSEALLETISSGFGVTPSAAKGVLFVQLLDQAGAPQAGIDAADLVVAGGAIGPKFLDVDLRPLPAATASTASGWAVFFEVPVGVVTLGQAVNATRTVDMPSSPVNAGVVTLAEARVAAGAPTLPTNVSFANDVYPIFARRGCTACHSGGGPGKDLGGLHLDAGANLTYRELVAEKPSTRVQVGMPEQSWVLTFPSREDPPDRHPNITFASPGDPDYQTLLVWIREGAKNN